MQVSHAQQPGRFDSRCGREVLCAIVAGSAARKLRFLSQDFDDPSRTKIFEVLGMCAMSSLQTTNATPK